MKHHTCISNINLGAHLRYIAAASLALCCVFMLPPRLRAENSVLDTFCWGDGTTRTNIITSGTPLMNVAPEKQSAVPGNRFWKTIGSVVLSGSAGPGQGWLNGTASGVFKIDYTPAGQCSAVIHWAKPGGCIGWQAAVPDKNLFVNQSTDRVYCKVVRNPTTGEGNITLSCRIAGVTVSSTSNSMTLTDGPTQVAVTLDMKQRTASATVQDQTSGRSATTQVSFPAGTPQWATFAANTWSGAVAYQCEITTLNQLPDVFPLNMSFKARSDGKPKNNLDTVVFDTLANAKNFRIHHLPAKAAEIQSQGGLSPGETPIILRLKEAFNPNGNLHPGHLLYYTGSPLSADITANQTTFNISKAVMMDGVKQVQMFEQGDAAVIYKRGSALKPVWSKSEIVKITSMTVNPDGSGTLTVSRGESLASLITLTSTAKAFSLATDKPAISPVVSNWTKGAADSYENPSTLRDAISATSANTTIYISAPEQSEEADQFEENGYAVIYKLRNEGSVDDDGRSTAEMVAIEHVKIIEKYPDGRLLVARAQLGTIPLAHAAGKYIHAFDPNSTYDDDGNLITGPGVGIPQPANINPEWNRAPVTPNVTVDSGPYAGTYTAAQYQALLRTRVYDGLEFDVTEYTHMNRRRAVDIDVNLVADYGYIGGVNLHLIGWQDFAAALRAYLGPAKIIQFDSFSPRGGYRGWKYANGIQMEAFMQQAHFSTAFEHLLHWMEAAWAEPRFSYPYSRRQTGKYFNGYENAPAPRPVTVGNKTVMVYENGDKYFRRVFAAGLMAGTPAPYGAAQWQGLYDWPEQRGGELNNYTWLGAAKSNFARDDLAVLLASPNLLNGTWSVAAKDGWICQTNNGSITSDQGLGVTVTTIPAGVRPAHNGVAVTYTPALTLNEQEEYTLVFEAKADDTVAYNGVTYEAIPRAIRITGHGGSDTQSMVLADNKNGQWRTYYFSFVPVLKSDGSPRKFQCSFGVGETPGTTWIRKVRLYQGSANRLWRVFENGVVFLNESNKDWILKWGTHFSPYLYQDQTVPGTPPERYVRKLKALGFDNGTDIYDGQRITSLNPHIVPPNDARFYYFYPKP